MIDLKIVKKYLGKQLTKKFVFFLKLSAEKIIFFLNKKLDFPLMCELQKFESYYLNKTVIQFLIFNLFDRVICVKRYTKFNFCSKYNFFI